MNCFYDINPTNAEILKEFTSSDTQDVSSKVALAKTAFENWRQIGTDERIQKLYEVHKLIEQYRDDFVELLVKEVGKPVHEAGHEVTCALNDMRWYLEHAKEYLKDTLLEIDDSKKDLLVREPWGVVAAIAPFNVPLEISIWGVIPSLLAGNTVVYKPSEYTSQVGELLNRCFVEAGMDEGVFNIIYGAGDVGKMLVDSDVDFVWFTGSTAVGQEIYSTCGKKFINSVMELGGCNATIVLEDATVDEQLISNICIGRFFNCGQICSAIKRVFVHRSIYENFRQLLIDKVSSLVVGDPMNEATEIGPMVSDKQRIKVSKQVQDAVDKGAKVECGGEMTDGDTKGYYYLPTVLTGITSEMSVAREEVFGPVLPIIVFDDEDEAIELINDTDYGLSSEIYTNDISKAEELARKIQAGRVAVNMPRFASLDCPMGGYKKSGKGREHGKWIFEEMTQLKHIMIKRQ